MGAKRQVLVVDDTAISLAAVERALSDAYEVVTINSGIRALRYLAKETPDLILLDINMANKNGIETLRDIRELPNGKNIPVIMLTGVEEKKSVIESVSLGIYDYVLKPFDHDDLRKRIQVLFQKVDNHEL